MAAPETIFFNRESWEEEQQTWHWTKPVQHSSTRPAAQAARLHDKLHWAALLLIVLACGHFTATDHGVNPQPLSTSAELVTGISSSTQQRLSLHSSVSKVDLNTGLLQLELLVQTPTGSDTMAMCSSSNTLQHELVVGSTSHGAAQAVVPLCTAAAAGQPISVALPLIKHAAPHPFDEYSVEIKLRLSHVSTQVSAAAATATAATAVMSNATAVLLEWYAIWAVQDLQVAVERKMSTHAKLLSAVAGADSALMEQLGSRLQLQRQADAVFSVRLMRSSWLRIIHLTAALVQVVAVGWCCMLLLGHCLCAYLMQRFILCSTVHGVS